MLLGSEYVEYTVYGILEAFQDRLRSDRRLKLLVIVYFGVWDFSCRFFHLLQLVQYSLLASAHVGCVGIRFIIMSEEMQHPMYYKQVQFIFKCMPLICSLPLGGINRDNYITKGNSLSRHLRSLTFELTESQHVGRPVCFSVFSVQLLYMFIIREDDTYFGRFTELLNLQRLLCGLCQPFPIHRSRLAILY